MDYLAPLGPVYQAGTLSGNPLAMAAGIASLKLLRESMPYEKLEQLGSQLAQGVAEIARENSIPLQVPQVGSMYCLFFSESPVRNYEDALSSTRNILRNSSSIASQKESTYLRLLMRHALSVQRINQTIYR